MERDQMKQPTPSEYLQYAQQMSKLRAQQEMEKLRLVYAQHSYVLEQVPHLKPAFEALLVLDETRDYAALAQQIDQNLVALEAWLLNTWQPALRQYPELRTDWAELVQHIELYQFRRVPSLFVHMQQQIVDARQQRVDAEARSKREAEEKALRNECAKWEMEKKARRELEKKIEPYWSGFQKIGRNSETLPLTAPQWAAVKDLKTGLIWATNWAQGDDFPVTGGLSWYQSGVRLVEEKGFFLTRRVEKPYTDGYFNEGKNTESHIQRINQQRWCGQQDWYLPSNEELESLANAINISDEHREYLYQAIFPNDYRDLYFSWYWSSSPNTELNDGAWFVSFCDGLDFGLKGFELCVRAVRAD
jgi:hypothetical protein